MSPGAIVVLLLSVVSAPDAAITAVGPLSRNFDYPHPVKFLELEDQRQELRLAYLDVAPARPSGQVALLLHGENFSAAWWAPTIAAPPPAASGWWPPTPWASASPASPPPISTAWPAGHLPQGQDFPAYSKALLEFLTVSAPGAAAARP